MTDNGSCYRSRRFAAACRRLAVRHYSIRIGARLIQSVHDASWIWRAANHHRFGCGLSSLDSGHAEAVELLSVADARVS
jgi:hypothetical protein